MVHVITETRIAVCIKSDHTVDVYGRSIRKDDPVPSHLHAVLSVQNPRVVLPHKAGTLWDQQVAARGGVEHIGTDESFDVARNVGIQALLQDRWNLPAS